MRRCSRVAAGVTVAVAGFGVIVAELRARTGGCGPDVCIQAVGMEAHGAGPQHLYDQVEHQTRLQTDRPTALREAIYACRKGGSPLVLGVFLGLVDGEITTGHLATHLLKLEDGPRGYEMFKNKRDGCVRAVFQPSR